MKIEEMVLSIEQMEHLYKLGLEVKDTAIVYLHCKGFYGQEFVRQYFFNDLCGSDVYTPTLTLQEILELLPSCINVDGEDYLLDVDCDCIYETSYYSYNKNGVRVLASEFLDEKSLNSTYRMLCWVLENGYLKCK